MPHIFKAVINFSRYNFNVAQADLLVFADQIFTVKVENRASFVSISKFSLYINIIV